MGRVPADSRSLTPLTGYQWKLFVFLSVATFFEGYDFIALSQILPNLRAEMGLDKTAGGLLVTAINAGTVIAYLLVRKADRRDNRALQDLKQDRIDGTGVLAVSGA